MKGTEGLRWRFSIGIVVISRRRFGFGGILGGSEC
jgi:hypothetical protein